MTKIAICGNYGPPSGPNCGQSIKTHRITKLLGETYKKHQIEVINTYHWKRRPLRLLWKCLVQSYKCNHILVLPAHNGVRIFIPLFLILSHLWKNKIHYIVIGAWLADLLAHKKWLLNLSKRIDYIYVETKTLKGKLLNLGMGEQVIVMKNYKAEQPTIQEYNTDLGVCKLCMLSRINIKKGIISAIKAVIEINKKYGTQKATLDLYGPIEKEDEEEIMSWVNKHSDVIKYLGFVETHKTVEVLKEYYLLLFPTKYYTEGIPGTILDAYFSGVPVIASRWESCHDIIKEGITGITFEFNNDKDFLSKLDKLISNPVMVNEMKKACHIEAAMYQPEHAMKCLFDRLK